MLNWLRDHRVAALIASSVLIALLVVLLLPSFQECVSTKYKEAAKAGLNEGFSFFFRIHFWCTGIILRESAELITALATVVLTGSTIGLWYVTKESADAAKKSVDALPIIERGYLFPILIDSDSVKKVMKDAEAYWHGDPKKMETRLLETPEVWFKIVNYGKTPAILKRVFAGVYFTSANKIEIPLAFTEGVLGEKEFSTPMSVDMIAGLTPKQAGDVSLGKDHMWFSGKIFFIDIWGNECVTDFIFDWHYMAQCFVHRHISTTVKS